MLLQQAPTKISCFLLVHSSYVVHLCYALEGDLLELVEI
jgi:hypothetical protein